MTSLANKRSSKETQLGTKKTKITDFFLVKKKAPPSEREKNKNEEVKIETKEVNGSSDEADNKSTQEKQEDEKEDTSEIKEVHDTEDKEKEEEEYADDDENYTRFCAKYKFDKEAWVASLTPELRDILQLEIDHLHITWLTFLHKELTKPYFVNLKLFLKSQQNKTIFPPKHQIYSWSHYTPLPEVKCLVIGQDPYHNFNQAHGLAFSVLEPTKPPPSLQNIYKTVKTDYPKFQIPDSQKGGGGNLTQWAKRGVFLLNTCLTVEAHKPNSHSKRGWETFTQQVIDCALNYHNSNKSNGFVVMAWGMPAQNALLKFPQLQKSSKFHVIKTFHPSPFSAAKGFFTLKCFKSCNDWLETNGRSKIDWSLVPSNSIFD